MGMNQKSTFLTNKTFQKYQSWDFMSDGSVGWSLLCKRSMAATTRKIRVFMLLESRAILTSCHWAAFIGMKAVSRFKCYVLGTGPGQNPNLETKHNQFDDRESSTEAIYSLAAVIRLPFARLVIQLTLAVLFTQKSKPPQYSIHWGQIGSHQSGMLATTSPSLPDWFYRKHMLKQTTSQFHFMRTLKKKIMILQREIIHLVCKLLAADISSIIVSQCAWL